MAPNITEDEFGNITFDGPEAVNVFQLVALKHALKLELETGLKHSRFNMREVAGRLLGTTFPRSRKGKEAALAAVEAKLDEIKAAADAERARREAVVASGQFGPPSSSSQ